MDSNIQTLVFKAKQGDNSAFSTLYQIYYPKMKGICINILKEDKDVIDDLVQDAFILALVSLKDLKNPNRFGQWLTSITSNLALKYKEKGNTFRYISLSDIDESVIDSCDDCRNTVSSIQYEDIMAEIYKLPDAYKKKFKRSPPITTSKFRFRLIPKRIAVNGWQVHNIKLLGQLLRV